MKVLQINYSDYAHGGGGAIAMHRLYQGLKNAGIDCKILCNTKTLDTPDSSKIPYSPRLEHQLWRITSKFGLNDIHCIRSFNIRKHEFYLNADILNFHIIHSGYFSYLAIPILTENKPAVFTLHDMWSFTGHCAYSYDCNRWKTGCGKCLYTYSYPAIQKDSTHLEWKIKDLVYQHSDLHIVTLSHWLDEQVKQSMLNRFPVYHIPNGIDTEAYQPLDSERCKYLLGIPNSKKVLMFGADILTNYRKGGDLLIKALQNLPTSIKKDIVLLTIGYEGEAISKSVDIPTLSLGYVSNDRLKSIAYSSADLFIFPTRADNLPLMIQESMACKTPIVSFNIGGISDLVRPGITGYLAQAEDVKDFCNGIVNLLEDNKLRENMSKRCREIILNEYPMELQAQRYIELYQKILK